MLSLADLPKNLRPFAQFFVVSGKICNIPPAILAAICYREAPRAGRGLDAPLDPSATGDAGHGHGLMQIDDRTWGSILRTLDANGEPAWKDPAWNISQGAEIARIGFRWFPKSLPAAIATYNAGPGNVKRAILDGKHPDAATTGGDYSQWVLKHARLFHGPACCPCLLCVRSKTLPESER